MSAEQFLLLRDAFCEQIGQAAPPLEPDASGTMAFHQIIRAYAVTFTYAPRLSVDDVFIMMDIGPMAQAAGTPGWHTLMQCNTLMFGKNSPVLGLSEAGHLMIQKVHPLCSANGQDLKALVDGLVNWADLWHERAMHSPQGDPVNRVPFVPGQRV